MKLFNEKTFQSHEQELLSQLKNSIESLNDFPDPLENDAKEFVEDFSIRPIKLDLSKYDSNIEMVTIPINMAKGEMSNNGMKTVAQVNYTVIVTLNNSQTELLKYRPSHFEFNHYNISVLLRPTSTIYFAIDTNCGVQILPEHIIKQVTDSRDKVFETILKNVENLNEDITRFNQKIYPTALESLKLRKGFVDSYASVKSKL